MKLEYQQFIGGHRPWEVL